MQIELGQFWETEGGGKRRIIACGLVSTHPYMVEVTDGPDTGRTYRVTEEGKVHPQNGNSTDDLHVRYSPPEGRRQGFIFLRYGPEDTLAATLSREQLTGYYVGTALAHLSTINDPPDGGTGDQNIRNAHQALSTLVHRLDELDAEEKVNNHV